MQGTKHISAKYLIMKTRSKTVGFTLCVVIPLTLLAAGCKERNDASVDTAPTASRDSNAYTRDAVAANSNVDNTRVNVRDRNQGTLTPGDQGSSEADRALTQKIRQTVVSTTNDYTMTARNIKIITVNGKVTLRGPVNTQAEKMGIESLAKSVAGADSVDNQLEVKTNP
jgi:hypothetical protein